MGAGWWRFIGTGRVSNSRGTDHSASLTGAEFLRATPPCHGSSRTGGRESIAEKGLGPVRRIDVPPEQLSVRPSPGRVCRPVIDAPRPGPRSSEPPRSDRLPMGHNDLVSDFAYAFFAAFHPRSANAVPFNRST